MPSVAIINCDSREEGGKKQPSALVKQAVPVNNGGIFDSYDGPNEGDGMHTELRKTRKKICVFHHLWISQHFHPNDL